MTDQNHAPVQSWDADKIVPYEHNHKKHSDKQVDLLAKLIEAKGLINPLVLEEDGTIIAGHGRFLAIQKLGWTKVPVRVMVGISKSDASILRIADNKTVSTEYDVEALTRELAKLDDGELDLTMLGMDQRELDMLLGDVGTIDHEALVDDIDIAIEAHETDVNERAAAADEDTVRLDKAFGFKTVPLPCQKTVTRFMAEIEASTGKVGADALTDFMIEHLAKAA